MEQTAQGWGSFSPSSGVRRPGDEVTECQGSPRKLLMQKHLSGG